MRFRLGINATGSQPDTGFGRGFAALASLPLLQAQAADEASKAQAEGDLRAAQQRQADAHAALFQQQANEKRTQLERGGLGELLKNAALQNGVPLSQVDEASNYLQSGQLAGKYELPGGQAGPTLPKPQYADPGVGARIFNALGLTRQALALGDQNIEHLAKAGGEYQRQDDVRRLQADPSAAGVAGQAYAAVEGRPLIDNVGTSGRSVNRFTGQGGVIDPGMAVLFDQGERAQINQRNATAGASNASAEHSRASTEKVRQEITEGRGQGKAPAGYRWKPDGSLEPIPGGPAANKEDNPTEGERKSGALLMRLRGSQQQLLNAIGQNPSAEKPLAAAEFVRSLPVVGGDTPANLITPEARQQVEAAQLDMLDAALTLGTGAAYTKEQLRGYAKSYFPQVGDGPKAIADKKVRLANVIRAAEIAAGRAAKSVQPVVPAPATPQSGGASGGWGAPAAPAGWSIQRVN